MENNNILIVNNTDADLTPFHNLILFAAKSGEPLADVIRDVFKMTTLTIAGQLRIIIDWA